MFNFQEAKTSCPICGSQVTATMANQDQQITVCFTCGSENSVSRARMKE